MIPPQHTWQVAKQIGTNFDLEVHLVGFARAGPAHCKMGAGGAPRRGIQLVIVQSPKTIL